MSSKIKPTYQDTNAYSSYWTIITANFIGKFREHIRAISCYIWGNYFNVSNGGQIEYQLIGDQLAWKRNFHLKKYLQDNNILRFQGTKLVLLDRAISFFERARKEMDYIDKKEIELAQKEIELAQKEMELAQKEMELAQKEMDYIDKKEIELAQKDLEIQHVEESKEELVMWHDERIERMEKKIDDFMARLSKNEDDKTEVERHLKLVPNLEED